MAARLLTAHVVVAPRGKVHQVHERGQVALVGIPQQRNLLVVSCLDNLSHGRNVPMQRRHEHLVASLGQPGDIAHLLLAQHTLELQHQLMVWDRHASVVVGEEPVHDHGRENLVLCREAHCRRGVAHKPHRHLLARDQAHDVVAHGRHIVLDVVIDLVIGAGIRPIRLERVVVEGKDHRTGVKPAPSIVVEIAVVPKGQAVVGDAGIRNAPLMDFAQRPHLVVGEAEEPVELGVVRRAVLHEHVELRACGMLGDGQDARHIRKLNVGLALEELLKEHEERLLVGLVEQGVEEHRVPLVDDEDKRFAELDVQFLKRLRHADVFGQLGLGPGRAQVGDDAAREAADVVLVRLARAGQLAEIEVDDVMVAKMTHRRRVEGNV